MISQHFSRKEFACKCGCGFSAVDIELLAVLENVREYFRQPVNINSACRCEKHNEEVGGKLGSFHLKGMACDIAVVNVDAGLVHNFLTKFYHERYGIGRYNNFTHIDVRANKARW